MEVSQARTESIPLTTEEPIESRQLRNALKDINDVTELDPNVQEAVLIPKPNPNEFPTPAELINDDGDLASRLQKSKEDEEDVNFADPELMEITERNRHVALEEFAERPPIRSAKSVRKRQCLIFQDPPIVVTQPHRITVTMYYGVLPPDWDAGIATPLSPENPSVPIPRIKPPSKSRRYLVACDFSEESFFAIEWTLGTLMRDGDEIHLVTVVNREDNPELVEAAGMSLSKELDRASRALTAKTRSILNQMLLYDIKVVTYALSGKVKYELAQLISELPLTMVICGSRGRGKLKGLVLGSISTYLVHNSTVPVNVVRPQKKPAKGKSKKLTAAQKLSQSVASGQLIVDK
ncbi:hypothetical protein BGW37DRAFT_512931 [Umbelopsis sp. PMI_123]|nr:hypothetical protein BGW37DRAFT_512931 [Umbelopsis sp. PMI_123]